MNLVLATAGAADVASADSVFPAHLVATLMIVWGLVASLRYLRAGRAVVRPAEGRSVERVLVIGGDRLADEVVEEIEARQHLRQRIVGVVDDSAGPSRGRRLGGLRDLGRIVQECRPHRIIVAQGCRRGRMPVRALLDQRLRGIVVEDGVEVYERLTGKLAIEALTPSSVIFCKDFRPVRRDLDIARGLSQPLIAAALIALAPLLALIALAIRIDSPGPVFFVQERVGRGGRRFKLIKFRTMRPAQGTTSQWVCDNGDRVTRLGRWLRRFRIDELPQLVNILKGDMNLVGPRPHPVDNLPLFVLLMRNAPSCGEPIPYYALRWMVRPGITGWAQVRYRYANDLEEEVEKMRHDLYYIKHMSLWLDLRILVRTVGIVLRGHVSAAPAAEPVVPVVARPIAGPLFGGERQGELP